MSEKENEAPAPESGGLVGQDDMSASIGSAWKEISARMETEEAPAEAKPRAEDGKFAKKEEEAVIEAPPVEGEPIEGEPVAEAEPEHKPPHTWRKEALADWDKVPPTAKAEILKRENDVLQGLQQYKELATVGDSIQRTSAPYMARLQSLNLTPQKALEEFYKMDYTLQNGPMSQKVATVRGICNTFGIDPQLLLQGQRQVNPEVAALQHPVHNLTASQQREYEARQAQAMTSYTNEVTSFAKDKPHFALVADDMTLLINGAAAVGQPITLDDAYKKACAMNAQVQQQEQADQLAKQRADALKKANDAKKAAETNIHSRGKVASVGAVGSMDDSIRAFISKDERFARH